MKKQTAVIGGMLLAAGIAGGCTACYDDNCEPAVLPMAQMADEAAPAMKAMGRGRSMAARNVAAGNFEAPEGQQIAYTATLTVQVADIREALLMARDLVNKAGGYVKNMNDSSATLAVPVKDADAMLNQLSALGIMTSLQINSENVTDQIADIDVRMDNLARSRQRLLALLEKAGKVEEMVKVEAALTRVTTELERLQSQAKQLATRVQYVTMTLRCQAQTVQPVPKDTAPVGWVNGLGRELLSPVTVAEGGMPFDAVLPPGFVQAGFGRAVSAENCVLQFRQVPNAVTRRHWYGNEYAPIDFYLPMIRQALTALGNDKITEQKRVFDGIEGRQFTVELTLGGVPYIYTVMIFVDDDDVNLIEGWGRKEQFHQILPETAWETLLGN